ncbi:N-acetylglucosamine kinase-like BadF-type ATPase [Granulicella aggregans]|jgi:glucosamine kinase|uniref:N-acetylglucosamine kinase-like BadF-type ATPase n=1 Tax=Granulicella aggregans TaxID=474949 RepID=A0A7W7Z9S5_9BACT|nr:BadF/BadG/BcrA/BcrD ATPase family protein [Granulicella aggregans]MBB5055974.1 N-acetylglucosamine kinase-like BadF-type ATPase [Granulicella aggregans]
MSLFLAVDAGGTKTDYLVADDTSVLARVRGGTIKRMRANAETTAQNLEQALAELAAVSGISMQSITRTCIGTAGETVPLVVDWLRDSFGKHVSGGLILLGDVEIALDAAFPGQPGVVVLAGTGSNVAARDGNGVVTTAGGWGPALADQGSGHRIGLEALRALFLSIDEERPTRLLAAVLQLWHLGSVEEIVAFANTIPAPDFSQLAKGVLRVAQEGDAVAQAVLEKEGADLAYLACLLIARMRKSPSHASLVPPLAFTGSIMENVLPVRSALVAAVDREYPGIATLDGVVDPIAGALWRARRGY